jgi:hypothetical protein
VQDRASFRSTPPAEPPVPLRQHLLRTALVVLVLGVLPFAWGAHPAWQVLGTLVSVALVGRGLQLVWRAVFSTGPRRVTWG